MTAIGDIDGDGLGDFAIAAENATPFNRNNVGMAYIVYGRARAPLPGQNFFQGRYSGILSLNAVGTFVPFPPNDPNFNQIYNIRGTQMFGPAVTPPPLGIGTGEGLAPFFQPHGITSLASWPDITGDGTPELLIGMKLADSVAAPPR